MSSFSGTVGQNEREGRMSGVRQMGVAGMASVLSMLAKRHQASMETSVSMARNCSTFCSSDSKSVNSLSLRSPSFAEDQ